MLYMALQLGLRLILMRGNDFPELMDGALKHPGQFDEKVKLARYHNPGIDPGWKSLVFIRAPADEFLLSEIPDE